MEENIDFLEFGALAQILGAVAIFLSIILVIIEYAKTLSKITSQIRCNVQSN